MLNCSPLELPNETLFGNKAVADIISSDKVLLESVWALKPIEWCPYKRKETQSRQHLGKPDTHGEKPQEGSRTWSNAATSQGMPVATRAGKSMQDPLSSL
jgi:hypothetical protein